MWGRGPTLLFCRWMSSCRNIIYGKEQCFPIELSWHPCQKSIGSEYVRAFFLETIPHWPICLPWYQYHTILSSWIFSLWLFHILLFISVFFYAGHFREYSIVILDSYPPSSPVLLLLYACLCIQRLGRTILEKSIFP